MHSNSWIWCGPSLAGQARLDSELEQFHVVAAGRAAQGLGAPRGAGIRVGSVLVVEDRGEVMPPDQQVLLGGDTVKVGVSAGALVGLGVAVDVAVSVGGAV